MAIPIRSLSSQTANGLKRGSAAALRSVLRRFAFERLELRDLLSADSSWLSTFGGPNSDEARGVVIGPGGDAYVAGVFRDTVDFDPGVGIVSRTASAGGDAFVARYAAGDGSLVWVRTFGSANAGSIAVDAQGTIGVGGTFTGSVDVDGDSIADITSAGGADLFVAAFNESGGLHWARRGGGLGDEKFSRVTADDAGNWYLYGAVRYNSTADFGSLSISATADNDVAAMARLDAAGTFDWVHRVTFSNSAYSLGDVAVDASGAVFLSGGLGGTGDFGRDANGNSVTRSSTGNYSDAFLVKLTPDDRVAWVDVIDASRRAILNGIAIDDQGNLTAAGYFGGTVDLDPGPAQSMHAATGFGVYSPADAGYSSDNVMLLRLDANGGFLQGRTLGGTGLDLPYGVQLDSTGQALVTGRFEHEMSLDGIHLIAPGNHVFVAALDSNLQAAWAQRFGSESGSVTGSFPRGISAIDAGGHIYTAGRFSLTTDFPTGEIRATQGALDGYLLKWNPARPAIGGRVFFDTNYDGVDNDSNRVVGSGWIVYLDENDNGVRDGGEPYRATYDATGNYTFGQLPAGQYVVAVETPPGWTQSAPTDDGRHRVTLVEGQSTPRLDFGVHLPTSTQTFVSSDVPKAQISDRNNAIVPSVLNVNLPAGRIIVDADVSVRYTDGPASGVYSEVEIVSPGGSDVALWSEQLVSFAGLNVNTTFADEAGSGTTQPWFRYGPQQVAPFNAETNGQQFLADFDGEDPLGMWTLNSWRHDLGGGDRGPTLEAWSLTLTYAIVPAASQPPTIASLKVSPDPVQQGLPLTITANGVADADGTVASVSFYRDANGNGQLDATGDIVVGTDSSSNDGWSFAASTAGLVAGTYTYFAVATDNEGLSSSAVSAASQVVAAPPGNVNDIYVWDITAETRKKGSSYEIRVSVVVRSDSNADGVASSADAPVSGAAVGLYVFRQGWFADNLTGTTDATGTFKTAWMRAAAGSAVAEVTAVSKPGMTWNRSLDPTLNDTDADGDNLPDQQFSVPGGTVPAASAVVVQVSAAGSPTATTVARPVAKRLTGVRTRPMLIGAPREDLSLNAVDSVMRLYARRSRIGEDR